MTLFTVRDYFRPCLRTVSHVLFRLAQTIRDGVFFVLGMSRLSSYPHTASVLHRDHI